MIVRNNPLLLARQSATRIATVREKLERAAEVAATGTDVTRPSDAPGLWQTLHGLEASMRDQETWLENGHSARVVFDTADQTLGEASELFNRARERAVLFASGNAPPDARVAAAPEIAILRDNLLALANTSVGGRSLFAGDAYDGDAFDAAGNYIGGVANLTSRIAENRDVSTTIDGSSVFQGGVDVFQALTDLEAALAANDPDAVAATLDAIDAAQKQLIEARQDMGYRQAQVEDAAALTKNLSILLEARLTDRTSVQPTDAFTDLAQLQTTYQTTLQVTASASATKLFDFLR